MRSKLVLVLIMVSSIVVASGIVSGLEDDPDNDGLSTEREEELGTDPQTADTDRDSLGDGREIELGTDPTNADTDGDGLLDGVELKYGSEPTKADTDDDGVPDNEEIVAGTDPADPDSRPSPSSSTPRSPPPQTPLDSETRSPDATKATVETTVFGFVLLGGMVASFALIHARFD